MDALQQLMQKQDYNSISITDLTSRAGVSRMSYYRHYKSKDDILIDYMYRIVREYAAEFSGSSFLSDFQSYEHILYSLKYLKKYKDYVGHIHIAENHRYQPGTGSIDWKRHMETLKEIGYEGPVVNEGRIRGEDPLKVYQESVDFMKQFM